ncbi:hypothetical protein F5887DRAFT_962862 [Amanita rubescens]|nr:hypothetical protein F5887DRAFT_962862 [Amanita rubescens]
MPSTSVIRTRGLLRSPKSILRRASRPSPLPLSPSPFPFSNTFNLLLSVSARSPHVHFPPSPALFATFATHCPSIYDRGPYPVSPSTKQDALALTSPSLSGFKLSDPPKRNRVQTPAVFEHQDPRSPRPNAMQSFAAAMAIGSKPRTELKKALTSYPLSPYPSAPVTPVVDSDLGAEPIAEADKPIKTRGRASSGPSSQSKKRSSTVDGVRTVPRATKEKPQSIAFQLTSSRRLAPPHLDLTAAKIKPYLTPVRETTTVEDAPLTIAAADSTTVNDDLDALSDASSGESIRLSNAFWQSVSIEVEEDASSGQSNGILQFGGFPGSGGASSEGGFPESVTGSQASEDAVMRELLFSPRPGQEMMMPRARMPPPRLERLPTLTFGRSDGTIWSPGANEPSFSSIPTEDDALLAGSNALMVPRNVFTAPTPNDPFAKFPSFVAVLEAGTTTTTAKTSTLGSTLSSSVVNSLQLPPRVHLP